MVEIAGGARIVIEYVCVTVPPPPSVILTWTLANVPLTVGVPVIAPVVGADREASRQAGGRPGVADAAFHRCR